MKYCSKIITLLVVLAATSPSLIQAEKPNVVLIFADDLGYGDLSCYGATKIHTPNIDKLAAEGRKFTDAHSSSAVCTPSRYGLLTGEYPLRANGGRGVWGPVPNTSKLIIDTDKLTIADVFKNDGYSTAVFGKWHLGFGAGRTDWQKPLRPGPQDLGFDYYFGIPIVNSNGPYVYIENDQIVGGDADDPLIPLNRKNPKGATPITPIPPEAAQRNKNAFAGAVEAHKLYNDYTLGTTLTEKAVGWIEQNQDQPFFLYFATTNIHHPFTPAPQFQGTSQAGLYGDFVHELDWMVGEIVKCLEAQGVADNTLIIFTSDNGGMFNEGAFRALELGHEPNGKLLGSKFDAWEGGHRVPFIARWPGNIPAGTESDQLLCNVDMLATFAALTGQTLEPKQQADSVDMLPALLGSPQESLRKELLLSPYKPTHLAIRKGKWMYIGTQGAGGFGGKRPGSHTFAGPAAATYIGRQNSDIEGGRIKADAPPAQLYDLEHDLQQTTNLYDDYPEVVEELDALLNTYRPASKNSRKK
ncbi:MULTISPECIES: arylsulfatase [unclassified Lentimonas]|uniref:sulfatase family protein n=1 Tax=unclassified Lentimonas TaxID=2630993 RepID=UPI001329D739|nr:MULTISPECIES: arylsulfatase [unclassified Lentimonas]CAA6677659.1 Choline-sulfatase (EC [Lentimonas sp. CC4]CAA6684922.1 Choline-sulfatase (EC [Lentimonas sp. CC6]CAA7077965.1 Choline-sulfatase (EC [Lentimonas sp. CC4]CAA7169886.1 Choline-sulfatase (EC [Lentimonas sp. CC21]CAA7181458.1 Choline-sulfatase (EC [Lentimonas sp. CC8]